MRRMETHRRNLMPLVLKNWSIACKVRGDSANWRMWSIRIRPQPKRSASAATPTTAPVSLPRSKVFSTDSWHWSVEKSARTLDNKVLLQFSWYKLIWYQIGGSWNRSALKWQRFIIGCLCSYPALWGSLRSLDTFSYAWKASGFCPGRSSGQKIIVCVRLWPLYLFFLIVMDYLLINYTHSFGGVWW